MYTKIVIYYNIHDVYRYSLEHIWFLGPWMLLEWQFLAACRLEEVRILRRDGIAKVLGTLICIGGAITVSLYKGIVIIQTNKLHSMNCLQLEADQYTQPFRNLATIYGLNGPLVEYKINNFHLGIICLLFNTFSWAVYLNLQVVYLSSYLSKNLLKPLPL